MGYYGSFYDTTTTQTAPNSTTANIVTVGTTLANSGITLGSNQFTFANAGTYRVSYTVHFNNSVSTPDTVYVWIRKNGTDIADSSSIFTVPQNSYTANNDYVITVNASDYIQFYWYTNATTTTISTVAAHATPTTPVTPGVQVYINQVMYTQLGPTGPTGSTADPAGASINTSVSITTAATSATFTADQIVVGVSLTGVTYRLGSFSQSLNLTSTGAGGMDTGTATANSFISVYAIYNPTTTTASILATLASTSTSTIYGGTHLPSGYTASALIAILPTSGTANNFAVAYMHNRKVWTPQITLLSGSATVGSYTSFSISAGVPPGAVSWDGTLVMDDTPSSTTDDALSINVAGSSTGIGAYSVGITAYATGSYSLGAGMTVSNIPVITSQTAYYNVSAAAGTLSFIILSVSYTF